MFPVVDVGAGNERDQTSLAPVREHAWLGVSGRKSRPSTRSGVLLSSTIIRNPKNATKGVLFTNIRGVSGWVASFCEMVEDILYSGVYIPHYLVILSPG